MLDPENNADLDEIYALKNLDESINQEAMKLCNAHKEKWTIWEGKTLHGITIKSDKTGSVNITSSFAKP
jgi:hypothetical protein